MIIVSRRVFIFRVSLRGIVVSSSRSISGPD
jgi:hypothetical protein